MITEILEHPTELAASLSLLSALGVLVVWVLSSFFVTKRSYNDSKVTLEARMDKMEHGHEMLMVGPFKELTTAIQAVIKSLDRLDDKSELRHEKMMETLNNLDRRLVAVEEKTSS